VWFSSRNKTFSCRNISLHVWAKTSYWIVWTLSTVFRPTSIKLFPRRTRASFWLTTWNCNKQLLGNLIKQLLDNVIKQLLSNLIKQLLANLIKQLCSILILVLFLVLLLGILWRIGWVSKGSWLNILESNWGSGSVV